MCIESQEELVEKLEDVAQMFYMIIPACRGDVDIVDVDNNVLRNEDVQKYLITPAGKMTRGARDRTGHPQKRTAHLAKGRRACVDPPR